MIYKYDIKEINGLQYIKGSRLISEKGMPSEDNEFTGPFGPRNQFEVRNITDENGKYQWTIRDNPDYNPETDYIDDRYFIENNPEPFTPDEIVQQKDKEKKDQLDVEYPQDKILELQDQAIQALARGEKLPNEYADYVAFKESIYK